jgi:hypothetical protein
MALDNSKFLQVFSFFDEMRRLDGLLDGGWLVGRRVLNGETFGTPFLLVQSERIS